MILNYKIVGCYLDVNRALRAQPPHRCPRKRLAGLPSQV
jgi:hypothetical protein